MPRKTTNATNPTTRREVQSFNFDHSRPKSDTERARSIANHHGWLFNDADHLVDSEGRLIAMAIEDAALAMMDEGWILPYPTGVNWNAIPRDAAAAAAAVSGRLDRKGEHPAV